MREYWRKADHGARRNSQVRPLPNVCGSFGGFECIIAELSRLSASHAQHDRSRYGNVILFGAIHVVWTLGVGGDKRYHGLDTSGC